MQLSNWTSTSVIIIALIQRNWLGRARKYRWELDLATSPRPLDRCLWLCHLDQRSPEILSNYFKNKYKRTPRSLKLLRKTEQNGSLRFFKSTSKTKKNGPPGFFETTPKTIHRWSPRFFQITSNTIHNASPRFLKLLQKQTTRDPRDS